MLGAGPASPLSRPAAVRSGHARTLHRPRSRYGPARPLAWRGARTGSEPGGRAGTGVGSPRVPGWETIRGCGKGWASPCTPLLGLGMECGRVSVKGFVTGSLLPSPRLVFKRERRQRENVLLSRPHGLSCRAPGRQSGGGPVILGGKMDLPLYQQICLHVSLFARLDLSSPGALMCPLRCWMEGLECFYSFASVVRRRIVSMWLRKWLSLPLANGYFSFFPNE